MAKSYWNMDKEQLFNLCEEREIHFKEEPSQKEIVRALFDWDKDQGSLTEVVVEDEEGKLVRPSKIVEGMEMITVVFHNKDENDLPYVPLGLNGKFFYIPKDVEVRIPKVLITSVIDTAIETRTLTKKRSDGKIVYEYKNIKRFPYSVIE